MQTRDLIQGLWAQSAIELKNAQSLLVLCFVTNNFQLMGNCLVLAMLVNYMNALDQCQFLESVDAKKDILIYLNSPGGGVYAGLGIYDTMQYVKPDISTLCIGQAASMGSFLLAAGTKGKRFSLPNSRVMVHQPSAGFQGQVTDIEIHAKEIIDLRTRLNKIYEHHTGKTLKQIEKIMERDTFMSPDEALAMGLIDEVVSRRPQEDDDS